MPAPSPCFATERTRGLAIYDADRAAGRMVPTDRAGFANAFALIATALPERRSDTPSRMVAVPKPRKLAPVRSCLTPEALTETLYRMNGGR